MNIKKAVEEVEQLKKDIDLARYFSAQKCARLAICAHESSQKLHLSEDEIRGVVETSVSAAKARIAKLQPIIDMANMALKGMEENQ